jgi:hypothetical protein
VRVRFQADADLDVRIILGLKRRQPEIDFQTAAAAGLEALPDSDVLALSAAAGRVLVTHDRRTMPVYFSEFVARQRSSGVIVVRNQTPIAAAIEELLLIWNATEAEEWSGMIVWIPL